MVQFIDTRTNAPQNPFLETTNRAVGQGLGLALQDMFEQKRVARDLQRQRSLNAQSATSLADQLRIPPQERKTFVDLFSGLSPEKQIGALKNMAEAQIYNQFTGMGGQEEEQDSFDVPQEPQQRQIIPEESEPLQDQRQQAPQNASQKIKINGVEFDRSELPRKQKTVPPFGPLQKQAEIQESQRKENRKRLDKFIEPYRDVSALQSQKNKLLEAKKIIKNKRLGGKFRNAFASFLAGDENELSELLKTADAQKLYSLLYESIRPKELGGSNPSTREVLLSLSRLPSGLKDQEANEYIIDRMIEEADRNLSRGKTINAALKYDKNIDADDLADLLAKKVPTKVGSGMIMVRLPDGREGELPEEDLEAALAAGAKRIDE